MAEMNEHDDATLLRAFDGAGSEKAFAEIARRYAGLIYHAALRRTGHAELAQEAAQNTLAILARKAGRVDASKTLAPWLYRTALYEASKIRRREARHAHRMKLFHRESSQPEPSEDTWNDALPYLDGALEALSESDRQVVMLKYFSGWTFEQMAERLGGKAAAWRQRGSRAVERLRGIFAKRGVTLPTAAIVAGLASSFSQSAPAAVLSAMSATPVAAASTLSWKTLTLHSLHLMNAKQTALVAGVAVATLIPLGYQFNAVSKTRARVADLQTSVQALRPKADSPETPTLLAPGRRATPRAAEAPNIDLVAWADAIVEGRTGGDFTKMIPIQRALAEMDMDTLETLLLSAAKLDLPDNKKDQLLQHLFGQYFMQNNNGRSILHLAAKLAPDFPASQAIVSLWMQAAPALRKWAKEDPSAALAWFRAEKEKGTFEGKGLNEGGLAEQSLSSELFLGLIKSDRQEAMAFLDGLPDTARGSAISRLGGLARDAESQKEVLALVRALPDAKQGEVLSNSVQILGGWDLEAARSLIKQAGRPSKETRDLLIEAARGSNPTLSAEQLSERVAWLKEAVEPSERGKAVGYLLGGYGASGPGEAVGRKVFENELAKSRDDEMIGAFVRKQWPQNREDLENGLRMALTIQDQALRERTIREAMGRAPKEMAAKVAEKLNLPVP